MELVEAMEESEELHVVEIDQMAEELEVVQVHGEAIRFLPRWNSILQGRVQNALLMCAGLMHSLGTPLASLMKVS